MNCGIYCIQNIKNGKRYIGQSITIEYRIQDHLSALRKNRHKSKRLQKAWNEDGEENFIVYIVQLCNEKELDEIERNWIWKLAAWQFEYGYNLTAGNL